MTELVNPAEIEQIVGVERDQYVHYGRMVTDEETFYVLHSQDCVDNMKFMRTDLRICQFSQALDRGIDAADWAGWEDQPVRLHIFNGYLQPLPD
jgi:hypothetical protein